MNGWSKSGKPPPDLVRWARSVLRSGRSRPDARRRARWIIAAKERYSRKIAANARRRRRSRLNPVSSPTKRAVSSRVRSKIAAAKRLLRKHGYKVMR